MPSSKRPRSPELGDGAPRGKRVSKARKAARRQRRRDNREQVEITVTFRHDYDWPFGDDDSTYKDREPSLFNDDPPANAQVMNGAGSPFELLSGEARRVQRWNERAWRVACKHTRLYTYASTLS